MNSDIDVRIDDFAYRQYIGNALEKCRRDSIKI